MISGFFAKLRDFEANYHDRLVAAGSELLEKVAADQAEYVHPFPAHQHTARFSRTCNVSNRCTRLACSPLARFRRYMAEEVRAMLQDKDTLMGVINAAHDARVARLDAKEDELRTLEDR